MAFLLVTQESGESAEGAHLRPLSLRVSALPARRPAEGADPDRALRPVCPPLPPLALLLHRLLARSRPAPRRARLSHPDVPTQSQRRATRLSSPNASTYLPQPQPGPTAAVAVATSISWPGEGGGAAGVHPFGVTRCACIAPVI